MSGVIGRIKSAASLSRTSGFETFSTSDNGGFGLDWINDELMTVKRARRLYLSPIISVCWSRRANRCSWKAHPHAESPEKGIDLHMRARPPSPGLSHPPGAFNKSFQAIGGPRIRGRNHRRTAGGGSVQGMAQGENHCSVPGPSHQDGQRGGERSRERHGERE